MKVKTSKGFTLAELLIVMAIIVVLAAVAIPTFGRQLETARETGDMELIRSAYTEALAMAVLDASDGKLDGMNGGVTLGTSGTAVTTLSAAAVSASNAVITSVKIDMTANLDKAWRYVVELSEMDSAAKIKQTGTNWQYVNDQIVGATVPAVTAAKTAAAATTKYTHAIGFNFEMSTDGNVHLMSGANGIVVNEIS